MRVIDRHRLAVAREMGDSRRDGRRIGEGERQAATDFRVESARVAVAVGNGAAMLGGTDASIGAAPGAASGAGLAAATVVRLAPFAGSAVPATCLASARTSASCAL
jgi:hypothetical protein